MEDTKPFFELGAHWDGRGTSFSLYSKHAKEVELLLFKSIKAKTPSRRERLTKNNDDIWSIYLPKISPGQFYGYKVYGPYKPQKGHRFNSAKLLLDPYARAIAGSVNLYDELFAYPINQKADLIIDNRDSTPFVPKCVVVDPSFNWDGDQLLKIPVNKTIIYEVNVKGFTIKHPSINKEIRGTYAGLASREVIKYLKDLGITAVELLPIHHHVTEKHLFDKGLPNYWGYNTINYFAPDARYSASGVCGEQVREFKNMVKQFHKAGIEVILDVVYNHTAEGNHLGPTLCFRGIDNLSYYHLDPKNFSNYIDFSGCGNSLNMANHNVLKLIKDSLMYWVIEMHVDGFRFDLASALARELYEVNFLSEFFEMIQNDPVLSQVKLIAEPWDLGEGGYQVGNFPKLWSEWNGKYRDTMRRFIRGDANQIQELGWRISGSADLYQDDGRCPCNSINFITSHDGFTLNDLFSYNNKHNKDNGEDNRDGTNDNYSFNCGVEGETKDENILSLRKKIIKNALCCLLFSLGTPMLLAGDEFMRTQRGNNNAYCQDNEISWIDWSFIDTNSDIFQFCKKAIAFRKKFLILQRREFFLGKDTDADNVPDIQWFGENLDKLDWYNKELRLLCYQIDGGEAPSDMGDYNLFFIFNMDFKPHLVKIPQYNNKTWYRIIDTSFNSSIDFLEPGNEKLLDPKDYYKANSRSVVVLLGS